MRELVPGDRVAVVADVVDVSRDGSVLTIRVTDAGGRAAWRMVVLEDSVVRPVAEELRRVIATLEERLTSLRDRPRACSPASPQHRTYGARAVELSVTLSLLRPVLDD